MMLAIRGVAPDRHLQTGSGQIVGYIAGRGPKARAGLDPVELADSDHMPVRQVGPVAPPDKIGEGI
jgi:hypothetical protein